MYQLGFTIVYDETNVPMPKGNASNRVPFTFRWSRRDTNHGYQIIYHKCLEVELRLSFNRWLDQRSYMIKSLCHQIKLNRNEIISCIKITIRLSTRRVSEIDFHWIYFKSVSDSKINSTETKINVKIWSGLRMGIPIYTPKRYAITDITCAKMNHRGIGFRLKLIPIEFFARDQKFLFHFKIILISSEKNINKILRFAIGLKILKGTNESKWNWILGTGTFMNLNKILIKPYPHFGSLWHLWAISYNYGNSLTATVTMDMVWSGIVQHKTIQRKLIQSRKWKQVK